MRSGTLKQLRGIVLCLVLFAFAWVAQADDKMKCDICGQIIPGQYYKLDDLADGTQKVVCEECSKIKDRCFVCNLPVKSDFKSLPDGRFICARDLKVTIQSEPEAAEIAKSVKDDLDRLLSRFITMPQDNAVQISIVDKFHLENLFHAPSPADMRCVTVFGASTSNPLPNGKFRHSVDLLSYLSKPRLQAVAAHEFGHTWVAENVKLRRRKILDKNTHEAFCELIAYKYMESLHDEGEMLSIKYNKYTVGQIQVLLEADARYGFNAIVDWMKDGEDDTLSITNLERLRYLKDTAAPKPADLVERAYLPTPAPPPEPNFLALKGISGTGQHRFALINNATLEASERGRVRVGQTNVIVRCLEIRSNSVVIEIAGAKEKKELFISTK
jgi:hypothetical protein